MPEKAQSKSVWKICEPCLNNKTLDIGSKNLKGACGSAVTGDLCILSYFGRNRALEEFVKSGYKWCPGRVERKKEGKCLTSSAPKNGLDIIGKLI